MKITNPQPERASVLLVTMIFIVTMATIVGSYLVMIQDSDQLVARSQAWNSALAIAEAGVEESLASLNAGTNFSFITRSLNGGTYMAEYFNASGTNTAFIFSKGSVTVPKTGDTISRTVIVRAKQSGLFMMGLAAINNITFNGNGISSDSWNSHDPTQSTNGYYNNYVGTNGDVASFQGIVSIGSHTINGDLYLGPNATYTGAAANVTGNIYTDSNLNFPDAALPTTDASGNPITWNPAPVANGIHTFTNANNNGYYQINDTYPITVTAGVSVTLDVKQLNWNPGTIDINGGTTNSGTVIMYIESGSITLKGNSSGGASGNRPENLYVYGLPAVTSITLSGTSSFVGAIYSPEAVLTLNGGGNANNLIGAAVVNTVTLNGHYDFHYDESLATNGVSRGFIVASWQEQ